MLVGYPPFLMEAKLHCSTKFAAVAAEVVEEVSLDCIPNH